MVLPLTKYNTHMVLPLTKYNTHTVLPLTKYNIHIVLPQTKFILTPHQAMPQIILENSTNCAFTNRKSRAMFLTEHQAIKT